MDFKRIEWIFFIAFLGLNIFLFTLYREARLEQNVTFRSNQKIAIETRLASDNIKYEAPLSTQTREGYYLSGDQINWQDEMAAKSQSNPNKKEDDQVQIEDDYLKRTTGKGIFITDLKNIEEVFDNFLKDTRKVSYGKEYTFSKNLSILTGDYPEIVASQSYEEIPINDPTSRFSAILEKQDELWALTKYTQTYVADLVPLREAMPLYSESDAINLLYSSNKLPAESKIKWRELAYSMTMRVRGKNVYVPTWFIGIETPDKKLQVEKVNALTNRVTTTNPVRTVDDL